MTVTSRQSIEPPHVHDRQRWMRWALGAIVFLTALIAWPPWTPEMPSAGLDPSFPQVLTYAFSHHWQFGRDIVYTLGPYGFLYRNVFDPATYGLALSLWLALSAVIALTLIAITARLRLLESALLAIVLFVALRAGIITGQYSGQYFNDALFFLVPLLLVATYCSPGAPFRRVLLVLLVASAALAGLVKLSFALLGLAIVIAIELHRVGRGRFTAEYLSLYLAFSLLFFLAAGQEFAALGPYLRYSLEMAGGYGEAMQIWNVPGELLAFIAMATLALAASVTASAVRARRSPQGGEDGHAALPVAFAIFLFMVFKAGFVRHDIHILIAWSGLAAGFAAACAWLLQSPIRNYARSALLLLAVACTATAVAYNAEVSKVPVADFARDGASSLVANARGAMSSLAGRHSTRLREAYLAARDRIRLQFPLPNIYGRTDMFPWNAAVALAHGLDYRPRPIFQSFAAYTPALARLNKRWVQGPDAASTLVFDVGTIDNRFPALDDGNLWPDLIARYDPLRVEHDHLMLERRTVPRLVELRNLRSIRTGWSTWVDVPETPDAVWAEIRIDKTLLGRIGNLLFKAPPVTLHVKYKDGGGASYNFIPPMASEGFVLSPVVSSSPEFAALFKLPSSAWPSGKAVSSVQFARNATIYSIPMAWFYRPEIGVTFERLVVGATDIAHATPGFAGAGASTGSVAMAPDGLPGPRSTR